MVRNAHKRPISVSLPLDLLARLDREAAEQQRSRSNMLSALLARALEAAPRRAPADAAAMEARRV